MNIIIFGAAGEVGSRIVAEALTREHCVTAVVRNTVQLNQFASGVTTFLGDAENINEVARLTANQDLAISAIRPATGQEHKLITATESILDGVAQSGIRTIIVGGAASLKLPGQGDTTVLTAPDFLPVEVMSIARACFAQHQVCKANQQADWTYLSPPAMLVPGIRTGKFRLGIDELIVDMRGVSQISMEDFAVVLLDEAEEPKHRRSRFTAAY